MKLSTRSYPHPVVGNRDDVPGAAFQASVEMVTDRETVFLDVAIKCSSSTVNKLVADAKANFVLHVECSNTLFRRAYEFAEPLYRCPIPADNLNDSVEVNVFAKALKNISGYKVDKAHSDYGSATFEVEKGNIVAVGEGQIFPVESPFDSLRKIGTIMQVIESPKEGDMPMKVDFNSDKIVIILSQNDFKDYKQLKTNEAVTTMIVIPALMEALKQLEEAEDDDRRWVRVLRKRVDDLELKGQREPLELAQLVLELPMRRTFAKTLATLVDASS